MIWLKKIIELLYYNTFNDIVVIIMPAIHVSQFTRLFDLCQIEILVI